MTAIFLAEDYIPLAKAMREELEYQGYHVLPVYSLPEGINSIATTQQKIDIAILDANLGHDNIDGEYLATLLRQNNKQSKCIIISHSGLPNITWGDYNRSKSDSVKGLLGLIDNIVRKNNPSSAQ